MKQKKPKVGDKVNIVQKKHYESGELTTGVVKDVLTKSRYHSRGHKVRLESGIIGRVQSFVDQVGEQKWVEGKEPREYSPEDLPGPDDLR